MAKNENSIQLILKLQLTINPFLYPDMIDRLLTYLKPKKSNIDPNLYDWKFFDIADINQYPNALHDMFTRKYDGIIIRNVFSEEEIALMKKNVQSMDTSKMNPTQGGHAYPKVFAQIRRPPDKRPVTDADVKKYFGECENLPEDLKKLLQVDFTKRVEEVFAKLSGNRPVEVPKGYDDEGRYANATIRRNYPNTGFISVHCGNYFQSEFPKFYEHLITKTKVVDQLSYFVTVSASDEGGELTLFDLLWKNGQTKEDASKDNTVILPDGNTIDTSSTSSLKRRKINPGPGDLLIFSGGPIWHKVELVKGTQERITIGGFLSFNQDESKIIYWS